ncbi:MAG: B12-binding domain-containing radical SAM protein [Nitrospiria bacterium]
MQLLPLETGMTQRFNKRSRNLLLLIDPYPEDNPYRMNEKEQRVIWFPKLSLPVIASRTPKTWDVRLVDEGRTILTKRLIDRVVQEKGPENLLVGISTQMTCYTPRAYEIADQFRARGVRVCLGGTHATYCSEEAKGHADVVVRYEADTLWERVIHDFERGRLKPFYEMESYPTMDDYPHPRVDLLPQESYMTTQCIQTTRGCHFDCDFCSVSPFNGKSSRRRPVEEVIREIQRIKEWRRSRLVDGMVKGPVLHRIGTTLKVVTGMEDGTIFAFVDDLHNSNRDYCKKLWSALKELDIKWGAQCTLFLGDEPEMVKLAAESGCVAMFVGMESINGEALTQMKKPFNQAGKYADQIRCFHDHGIMVNPGIIFGSDADDESIFESTVDFLIQCQVELAYINIATPLPGTVLFDRLKAEGRIFDWNWAHYDGKHVVFQPKRMSPDVLQEGFAWANRRFFSLPSILTRMAATRRRILSRWMMNWRFRQLVHRTCPKVRLSPMAKILKDLSGRLPSYETIDLIPNALHALKEKAGEVSKFLELTVRKNETLTALLVNLGGTLDRLNVMELKRRILLAAGRTKIDIILDFEHLQHATPAAFAALADPKFLNKASALAHVKFMNLKESFREAVDPALLLLEVRKEVQQG